LTRIDDPSLLGIKVAATVRRHARTRVASVVLGRLTGMAYDQQLADRIRRLIAGAPDLTEKKMFGGLAFLIAGNMAIAASSQGGAMVRVDPQQSDALVATTTASLVEMRGRPMPGWLHVSSDDLLSDDRLNPWVERGTGYARSLPPKQ
jgi:TfoX/Sxy family transcriptional regulator of competence genes